MTFTSRQVEALTGVTYRRLDHWCREGIVGERPGGSGSKRRWTDNDVRALRVLAAAADVGPGRRGDRGGLEIPTLRTMATHYAAAGYPDHGFMVVSGGVAEYLPTASRLFAFCAAHGAAVVVDLAVAVPAPAPRSQGGRVGAGSGAAGPSAVGRGGPPPRVRPTAAAGHPPAPAGSTPANANDPRGPVLADSHEGR